MISVLERFIGKSGLIKVSYFTVEAFMAEDYVIVSAIDEHGEPIQDEIIRKIFSLSAVSINSKSFVDIELKKMNDLENQNISIVAGEIAERNASFFNDEVDKLDNWSEDVKKGLELDLKKLDIDIKTAKTIAKKIINLEEKLTALREIKDSEKKRNEMRRRLYEAQDEVEEKKEKLLESIEAQLDQKSKIETLFTIGWKII